MIRREIKKLIIEHADGEIEEVEKPGMFYKAGTNYPGGANPKPEDRFTTHAIHWTTPGGIEDGA